MEVFILKNWQIIVTLLLPYAIILCLFLFLIKPYDSEFLSNISLFSMVFYSLPIYFTAILPWYYIIYLARHKYSSKAFYTTGIILGAVQPMFFAFVLNVSFASDEFLLFICPILIVGVIVATFCIQLFYNNKNTANKKGEAL